MKDIVDPEFDDRPAPKAGECSRGRCDGSGWIQVSQAYIDRLMPLLVEDDYPPQATVEQRSAMDRIRAQRRAGMANTSYPCPACKPIQFDRWNGGHWEDDHDRANCPECVAANPALRQGTGRRRRRREDTHAPDPVYREDESTQPPSPPPRLDIDG